MGPLFAQKVLCTVTLALFVCSPTGKNSPNTTAGQRPKKFLDLEFRSFTFHVNIALYVICQEAAVEVYNRNWCNTRFEKNLETNIKADGAFESSR